jgi:hypothetical protein
MSDTKLLRWESHYMSLATMIPMVIIYYWLLWCLDFIENRTIIFININIFFCAFNQCITLVYALQK